MKTIQRQDKILREDDETAEFKVNHQGYKYVPKNTWKTIRDAEKEVVKKDSGRTAPPPVKNKKK